MDPILFTFFILCLCMLIYRYMKTTYGIFEELKIPGPRPLWIFGNLKQFKDRNPLDVFQEMRIKYGDVYGYFEGFRPSVVINDPEMNKQILVKHFDKFHERPIYNPFVYYPDQYSLLNTSGQMWKHQRTVVATAFSKISNSQAVERIDLVSKTFVQCLTKMHAQHPAGFDISGYIDRFTLDAFALSGFDYHVNSLLDPTAVLYRFMLSFNKAAAADNPIVGLARIYPTLVPFLKLFDGEHRKIHEEHLREMKKLVTEQRQKLAENPNLETSENLISKILVGTFCCKDDMGKICKRRLSDTEVIGHLHSLVGGGLGTTNAALSFVIHCLAVHPEAQQKVYEEIVSQCGTQGDLDVDSLNQMKYTEMVFNESQRFYPIAPGVARTCTEDCEVNGVQFREGMVVRLMASTMYFDEQYFPEPEKFLPDRFSPNADGERHPYAFMPFGQGPRACIGMKYAILIMKAALVKLLQKYTVTTCSQTIDPLPTAFVPMLGPKNGVFVQLIPRKTSHPVTSQG